ncbi:DUF4377 domain-containing protein [Myroides phaeus]|uniref:DUF4377 domain-containing protein n=1 Tax=Myroides phaeus TaxID=702745 RepID=A0A1G8D8C6_9FLAO|nr:DUF4377 domain-containing protein [Myroides phaeus]MEC4117167.1 DUF4377 domain-containing protein [Myroides phaeus]SDH53986.1 protein of unknown function [Myroides phaeus]
MRKVILLVAIALGTLTSCKGEKAIEPVKEVAEVEQVATDSIDVTDELEDIMTLYIAPQKEDCVGVGPMKCLLVKQGEDAEWELMYQGIEGLDYQEGFEYKVEVRREEVPNPPADASSFRYVLVKEISKVKK